MLEDTALASLAMEDFQRRRESLSASPLAGVADLVSRGKAPVEAWLDAWQDTWPAESQGREFETLRGLISSYIERVLTEPTAQPPGPALREPLTGRLTALFRRESGEIGAAFAHLGLMLLDLERLRGGLVLRALFPNPQERPQWA